MATTLLSPGVSVTVTDQSQYLPAATNTVPFVLLATAQDKVSGTSTSIAPGTTLANVNQLYLSTSQRDLATEFGNPLFYTTTTGTPINGDELNEYGLQAAYSALGVSNQCFVLRANVDLTALQGSASRPEGTPPNGSYWLNTSTTNWGLFSYNPAQASSATYGFTQQTPIVITEASQVYQGAPVANVGGAPGSYAVVATTTQNQVYFRVNDPSRSTFNQWVEVGTTGWQQSIASLNSQAISGAVGVSGHLYINGGNVQVLNTDTIATIAAKANAALLTTGANLVDTQAVAYNNMLNLYGDNNTNPDHAANTLPTGQFSIAGSPTVIDALYGMDNTIGNSAAYQVTANLFQVSFTLSGTFTGGAPTPGQTAVITGAIPTAFDGTLTVVSGTSSSVVLQGYASAFPGNAISAGTVTVAGTNVGTIASVTGITTPATAVPVVTFVNVATTAAPAANVYYSITEGADTANATAINQYAYATATNYTNGTATVTFNYPQGSGSVFDWNELQTATSTLTLATAVNLTPVENYGVPIAQQSPHTQVPMWGPGQATPRPAGSVWNKTTPVNGGELLVISHFNSATGAWVGQNCPLYANDAAALNSLDPAGGGLNIAAGATYAQTGALGDGSISAEIFERYAQGTTQVTGALVNPSFTSGDQFTISISKEGSSTMTTPATVTVNGTSANAFVTAVASAGLTQINAFVNASGYIELIHNQGGVIRLADTTNINTSATATAVENAGFSPTLVPNVKWVIPNGSNSFTSGVDLSNWVGANTFTYTASDYAPFQNPANLTLWYDSTVSDCDILIHTGTAWVGYKNGGTDIRGYNLGLTDPNGPIVSPTMPTLQSDNTPLELGDLWVNTSDLELYPYLYRWENVMGQSQWVLIDLADQTTQNGILFADARWGTSGAVDPVNDPLPTIQSLLTSNYLDLDAPDPTLYPNGMLLWNMRRSGYNVKKYEANYFNNQTFGNAGAYNPAEPTNTSNLPEYPYTWVTASGLQPDGSMYAGRKAQRAMVVQALRASVTTNTDIRSQAYQFNLIACPGYPELIPDLVELNNDRNNTSFIIGDTPMRLPADSATLQAYATNVQTGQTLPEDNITTGDPYVAVYWPSALTTDNQGQEVVVPPSNMMIRTYIRSDAVSYPWFAPAGVRRGVVDNATAIGYIDAQTGEFYQTTVGQNVRDILYPNDINPITFIPGVGIVAYGQKTRYGSSSVTSALDRVNVARLVVYLRNQLQAAVQQYLFEPNDKITWASVTNTVTSLLSDIAAKRGLYDYLVVCDSTNNTPTTIDQNELWIDIAIEPVKAIEFIYIPVRVLATGAIKTTG